MNKRLLVVSLIAATVALGACSKKNKSSGDDSGVLPNGVYDVTRYADNADLGLANTGVVVITSTSLVEFYDLFLEGDKCDLDFTTKYDNDWSEKHTTLESGAVVTITPTEVEGQTLLSIDDELVTLQYSGEITPTTIADLTARTCGVVQHGVFPNGVWASTTRTIEGEAGEFPIGGGAFITDTVYAGYEATRPDLPFTDNACYHGFEADFVSGTNQTKVDVDRSITLKWTGSFETGLKRELITGNDDDDIISYTYVGPATSDARVLFDNTYSNACGDDEHLHD